MDLNRLIGVLGTCFAVVSMNGILFFLWFVYHFMTNSPMHMMILVSTLNVLTVWSYNRTVFTDAGTAKCDEWKEWADGVAELGPAQAETSGSEKKGHGWAAGQVTKCNQCRSLRPERAHHCRRCGVCVLRMDHHCPFIGNCIGFRNHKYFVLACLYAFLSCLAGMSTCREPDVMTMLKYIKDGAGHNGMDYLHEFTYTLALIFGIGLMLFCGGLFLQDMGMGLLNTNRIEIWYKGANPYRLPNPLDNFRQTFGTVGLRLLLPLEAHATSGGTRFPLRTKTPPGLLGLPGSPRNSKTGWLRAAFEYGSMHVE